jgi:hypothetical protein
MAHKSDERNFSESGRRTQSQPQEVYEEPQMLTTITCPKCNAEFPLTRAIAQPFIEAERAKVQSEALVREAALHKREQVLVEQGRKLEELQAQLKFRQAEIASAVEAKLQVERIAFIKAAEQKASQALNAKLMAAEQKLAESQAKLLDAENTELRARKEREELEREKRNVEMTITRRVNEEREKLRQQAVIEEQHRWKVELAERDRALQAKDAKLREAQQAELAVRREREALESKKRALELEIERRVLEERQKVREDTQREDYESHRLKLAERDLVIADMRKQVEELRRKAEQGSQRLQGEVQELDLQALLHATFPGDQIEPVPNGRPGSDVVHKVVGPAGLECGTILWESKRTKSWSNEWLAKSREDQRNIGAHLGVIATSAMPPGVDTFDRLEGVWVAAFSCSVPVAKALRQALIEAAMIRHMARGRDTKMERVYAYLTSAQFRQRVSAIVEGCVAIQTDLEAEKRFLTRYWSKRQRNVDLVVTGTAGMYGDLQAVVGKSLPEVDGLSAPLLDGDLDDSDLDAHDTKDDPR